MCFQCLQYHVIVTYQFVPVKDVLHESQWTVVDSGEEELTYRVKGLMLTVFL